jgi:hypothetical protein
VRPFSRRGLLTQPLYQNVALDGARGAEFTALFCLYESSRKRAFTKTLLRSMTENFAQEIYMLSTLTGLPRSLLELQSANTPERDAYKISASAAGRVWSVGLGMRWRDLPANFSPGKILRAALCCRPGKFYRCRNNGQEIGRRSYQIHRALGHERAIHGISGRKAGKTFQRSRGSNRCVPAAGSQSARVSPAGTNRPHCGPTQEPKIIAIISRVTLWLAAIPGSDSAEWLEL